MAKKILVVDDEPDIVKVIEARLKVAGYQVITAYNGREGLEKAKKEKPDLILLDVTMPGMDGNEVLNKLKEDADTRSIPVIMVTARREPDNIIKSLIDGGALDYVVKPFNAEEFLEKIKANIADVERVKTHRGNELLDKIEAKIKEVLEKE